MGSADHSSASKLTSVALRFQLTPHVSAAINTTWAVAAISKARADLGTGGGARSRRLSWVVWSAAIFNSQWPQLCQGASLTESPTREMPARCKVSMTLTTTSYFTARSALITTAVLALSP